MVLVSKVILGQNQLQRRFSQKGLLVPEPSIEIYEAIVISIDRFVSLLHLPLRKYILLLFAFMYIWLSWARFLCEIFLPFRAGFGFVPNLFE
jgi:hypothetical protein